MHCFIFVFLALGSQWPIFIRAIIRSFLFPLCDVYFAVSPPTVTPLPLERGIIHHSRGEFTEKAAQEAKHLEYHKKLQHKLSITCKASSP